MITKQPDRIKLKSFQFNEKDKGHELHCYSPMTLGDFNLVIGDNAQGKTRLFKIFGFIKNKALGIPSRTMSNFDATFIFTTDSDEEVIYHLEIKPIDSGNSYFEKISTNKKTYLCTRENETRVLLDETVDKNIENFFVPVNLSAISAIDGDSFLTIRSIRDFFCRMLFMDASRTNELRLDKNDNILDPTCTNLSGVISSWYKEKPDIYRELVEDFKRCFSEVKNIVFKEQQLPDGRNFEILALEEEKIKDVVLLPEWSSGMWRLLCIVSLPKTQFVFRETAYQPSMIFIDEIENGLDFKSLKFAIEYLKDYSDEMQMVLSSHSPSISEFVHPKNWHVIKRKGTNIKISNPKEVEEDLEKKLDIFRQRYWDFYTKHISNSNLYEPKS